MRQILAGSALSILIMGLFLPSGVWAQVSSEKPSAPDPQSTAVPVPTAKPAAPGSTDSPAAAQATTPAPAASSQDTTKSAAQSSGEKFVPLTNIPALTSAGNSTNLTDFLNALYKICIGIAVVLAVLQLIRAGIEYMTAGGSVGSTEHAKHLISTSLLGLILVLSPYIVFSVINPAILSLSIETGTLKTADNNKEGGDGAETPGTSCADYTQATTVNKPGTCESLSGGPFTDVASTCCSAATEGQICCAKKKNGDPANGDTTPPTVPQKLELISTDSTSVTFSWSASSDETGVTGYNVYLDSAFAFAVTGTQAKVPNLSEDTQHTFSVRAYDAAGNKSDESAGLLVRVGGSPNQNGQYAWKAQIRTAQGGNVITGSETPFATSNACWDDFNSTPAKKYGSDYVVVQVLCSCDTTALSQTGCSDLAPDPVPLAPTGLTSTDHSATSVSLTWNAAAAATSYQVYINGAPGQTTSSTALTVKNLTPGSTVKFSVKASNTNGSSPNSAEISVTLDSVSVDAYAWKAKFMYWNSADAAANGQSPVGTKNDAGGPFTTATACDTDEQAAYKTYQDSIKNHSANAASLYFESTIDCSCSKPSSLQGSACKL